MDPQNVKTETTEHFVFESYGVVVRLSSNDRSIYDEAVGVARESLLGNIRISRRKRTDLDIELMKNGRKYVLKQNSEEIASGTSRLKFFKFFDSVIRASVGEYSPKHVFLHAGAVGWKGQAIVLPADSFKGKSTLVTELVRLGATYLSDDFAILDASGFVHAFPRPIGRRSEDYQTYQMTVESIGGVNASEPMRAGLVLFTEYKKGGRWLPKILTTGKGTLEMIPFTLTFRLRPEFSLRVLNKVASHAIIASSPRGNATEFASKILNFVDKGVN
jgi:hypothetical protein